MQQLLPEWHPQEAVILAWPDIKTDWALWLSDVRNTYLDIICSLNANNVAVIMLVREPEIALLQSLIEASDKSITQLLLVPCEYNDTWLRDYGFLTCNVNGANQAISFGFNGWGNKFKADLDNQVNRTIFNAMLQQPIIEVDFVLEGGALEIDADGHLLSTQLCLSNPERNGDWDADKHDAIFRQTLGAEKITLLQHGHLEGDDTDGHVDTLVRYTPSGGLVIQSCFNRPDDTHFDGLQALVNECKDSLQPSALFELPLPYIENSEGERLPASYANYLISNQTVLAPIYGEPEDKLAIEVLQQAYPKFGIIPINCRPLVQQFGSLHCITMQVPENTFKAAIIEQAKSGITIYEQS